MIYADYFTKIDDKHIYIYIENFKIFRMIFSVEVLWFSNEKNLN